RLAQRSPLSGRPPTIRPLKAFTDRQRSPTSSALATVVACDHWKRSRFVPWKAILLVSAVFAFFCYKRQFASVGDALLETQPEKGAIEWKKKANYEKIAGNEFSFPPPGIEASSNLSRRAS